jgi:hypothetical protein
MKSLIIKSAVVLLFVVVMLTADPSTQGTTASSVTQQTWTGTISDNMCGATHQARARAGNLTDRQCVIQCIKELGRYVLVGENNSIVAIANQDFPGLPFHAGRAVKLTGELKQGSIVISSIEPAGSD